MIHLESLNMFSSLIVLYEIIIIDSIDIDLNICQSFKHFLSLKHKDKVGPINLISQETEAYSY